VLTAAYFLWLIQRVGLGQPTERWREEPLADVMRIEWLAWSPLLVIILALGVWPRFVFGVQDPAVQRLVAFLGAG
jgi:NADH-quinone oxidoreductase subunit M